MIKGKVCAFPLEENKRKDPRMKNTKAKVLAIAVCTAVVAVLGLAACGSSSSTSAAGSSASASTSEAAGSASNASGSASSSSNSTGPITTAAEEMFSNWLQGIDDNGVVYLYADDTTNNSAMLMVYDVQNDTFTSYTGKLEKPSDGVIKIDTKRAGEPIEFKVSTAADNSGTVYTFSNGSSVTMGPLLDKDVKEFLRSLDQFASEIGGSPAQAETPEDAGSAA